MYKVVKEGIPEKLVLEQTPEEVKSWAMLVSEDRYSAQKEIQMQRSCVESDLPIVFGRQ
jgi:hypothetical protein